MTSLSVVLGKVSTIEGDLDGLAAAATTGYAILSDINRLTATPATLADALDDARDVLNLPSTAVNLLKSAPFGIGTAVNLFENATASVHTTLGTYATTIRGFDTVLEPIAEVFSSPFGFTLDLLATAAVTVQASFEIATNDVRLLEQSFGDDPALEPFTELSKNLESFEDNLDAYLDVRDRFIGVLEPILTEVETAIAAVLALFPSVDFVEDLDATLNAIYAPIAAALNGLTDALDFEILGINVLDVIGFISDVFGFLLGFVEDVVTGFLDLLGFDLFGAIDTLLTDLLAPLAPVLEIVDQLAATLTAAVAPLAELLDEATAIVRDAAFSLDGLTSFDSTLFENTIEGDQGTGSVVERITDTLIGTEDDDAIFGLQGRDMIDGGAGDDFLFGGDGFDIIRTGSGRNEAWGNAGTDILINDGGISSLFGGASNDVLIGNAGDGGVTNFFGEAGDDTLIGLGVTNYYYFTDEDYGADTVIGFGKPSDLVLLSFAEFEEYFDEEGFDEATFAAENMSVEAEGTRLTTDEGSVLFVGVFDTETLIDSFIFG